MGATDDRKKRSTDECEQVQEAIDTIVQTFDHLTELSIQYSFVERTKPIGIKLQTSEEVATYKLVYEGDVMKQNLNSHGSIDYTEPTTAFRTFNG